jgi:hypothetical protein
MKRALQFALGLLFALGLQGMAAAQSATVITDKSDYAPGTIVTITGSGWQPGETVTLSFVESPLLDTHPNLFATADANGNIFNNQFSPDAHDISITFTLTAIGGTSGLQAQTTFTDGAPTLTITITGSGSVTAIRSSGTEQINSCNGGTCTFSNSPGAPQATCSAGTCIVQWNANYDATLTASPGSGFTFVGWSGTGGCTGTATCSASETGNSDFAVTATFESTPAVTAVSPNQGPAAGGTSVTITGTNFTGATAVKFGSTNATSFTVNSATQITATSPAGTGTVHITVTTPAGTSATSASDQFTYIASVGRRGQTIVAQLFSNERYAAALLE